MDMYFIKKRRLAAAILLLEDEEEEDIVRTLLSKQQKTSILYKSRETEGYFKLLINNHLNCNEPKFREFVRLNKQQFEFVLSFVELDLKKFATNTVTRPITSGEKLAVTLRFLATGETYKSLAFAFRISSSYISIIVRETLDVLCDRLMPLFLPVPSKDELKEKAREFWHKWNFPNYIAGINGKHIRMFCSKRSGSLFLNYKEYLSMVLLAMVDANCKFLYVDVGSYGKERIVGDEAFRIHRHLLKPFSKPQVKSDKEKAIFNYRLCRARRVTENAFGLLCQVFRIYYTPIAVKPETCEKLIMATLCLHNMLRDAYLEDNGPNYEYNPSDERLPYNFTPFSSRAGFANAEGLEIRQQFVEFLNNEGMVHWQEERISRVTSH